MGRLWATFEAHCLKFYGQKIDLKSFWKYFRVRTEKLHCINVKKSQTNFGKYFMGEKTVLFGVNTWRLEPDICSLICGSTLQSLITLGFFDLGTSLIESVLIFSLHTSKNWSVLFCSVWCPWLIRFLRLGKSFLKDRFFKKLFL